MQAPSKSEAEAWLEETGHYNQRNSQQNRSSDEEEHENENLSENEEEVLEDSDEREEYNEEEEDVDIEEQEEIEEDSQEQQEEGGDEEEEEDDLEEVQEIQQQENLTEDKVHEEGVVGERRRGHKPSKSQLPYGSPVKRAHTTNDHRRQTSRVLTSQREKSPFETIGKFPSDREMFKRLTGQSLSPTRSPEEFLGYYEKFCKGFLLKKEEELEKKRRQKEEDELAQLQDKPTLISRPQVKPYVPLLERTPLLNARREQEIEKIKREKEEKEQREFEELTFTPKINPRSKNLANSPTRERLMNVYLRTRHQFSQSPLTQRKVNRDTFHPKINPNSRNIVAMRDNASKDVVERLYQRADLDRAKKTELAKQLTPKFTPSLNKNTRKIAKQIEANYHNEQNETKRDKRKRSEVESHRTSSQLHNREESHLEQASDLELLDILKQFNSMLEQKNEGPINLQQLSTLMSSYAGKKKVSGDSSKKEQEYEYAEEDEEDENEEYEGQGLHEQIAQREMNADRPVKNYRAIPVNEEDSNPMSNIEKNLMHIQDSLQDLKENGGHSSQASSRTKTKKSRQHTDYNEHEHTEREGSKVVVQSKNSVGTRKKSATQVASERNTPARSQKSLSHVSPSKHDVQKSLSHVTPSKHDVNELEESKHSLAPASVKSVQKEHKEDYSSPDAAKITKKRAQTTTKKTNKKIKTYTDQSPRFDNESHNQIKSLKDARSLNEMFSHTVGSKNSLEGWNSHFEVQDQIIEGYDSTRDYQQEGKARGHVVEHSFGNQRNSANEIRQEDQRNSANEIRQEDQNYRSNHPAETSKPKSGFVKKTNVDRVKEKDQEKWRSSPTIKDQEKERVEEEYERGKASSHAHITHSKNQGSQNSIVSGSVKKDSYSQKSSSKEKRGRDQEEKKHRKSTTSSKDQSKKSVNLDDKASKAGSTSKVGSEYHQEDRSNRPKSGKGSRKVSFDNKPASDSRRSSIYEEEEQHNNLAGSQTKGSYSGYKKGSHEQQHGQGHLSTFANKYSNKRQEHEHEHQHRAAEDDDEVHSSIHGTPKVRSGDYMSFSANTLDQQPSFDDHQPPQNERKLTDEYESDGNKAHTNNSKGNHNHRLSVQGSPSKQRAAQFEVVTTETIQIEPQSAPRFSYSMDGSDKAITTASSSGLKAMAEQIVKKFKAYDAQIKQTAREYKMSVSPPRTASPSPEHHDNVHELETKKEKEHHKEHREHKVFKSVEKNGGTAKSSRNEIRHSRNSIPGSLSSVQSGRIGKKCE